MSFVAFKDLHNELFLRFDLILFSEVLRRCGGADRHAVGGCVTKWLSGSRDRNGKRLGRLRANQRDDSTAAAEPAAAAGERTEPASPGIPRESDLQQIVQSEEEGEELPMHMY